MTREQLEHVIRAATANADTDEIVIVGSQAILGSVASPTQAVLVRSMEADVYPLRSGWCLELHDLAVSKLAAGREKDMEFLKGMKGECLLDTETLRERVKATQFSSPDQAEATRARCEKLLAFVG